MSKSVGIKKGDIVVLKITGEKCAVLDITPVSVKLRRPSIVENGPITHNIEEFLPFEIETFEQHAVRQIDEVLIRQKAQMTLARNEKKMQDALQQEEIEGLDLADAAEVGEVIYDASMEEAEPRPKVVVMKKKPQVN